MENTQIIKAPAPNWEDHPNYRRATSEDFKYPQRLRFAHSNTDAVYTNSSKTIWKWMGKSNTWEFTNFPYDPSMFMIAKPKEVKK